AEVGLTAHAGTVPVALHARLARRQVELNADVPRTEAGALRALIPQVPLQDPLSVHAEVAGALPDIKPTVIVSVGPGEMRAAGDGHVGKDLPANTHIDLTHVDVRSFSPTMDRSDLGAQLDVSVDKPEQGPVIGEFNIEVPKARFSGRDVPAVSVNGRFRD